MSRSAAGRQQLESAEVTDRLVHLFDDFFESADISSGTVPEKSLKGNSGRNGRQKKDLSAGLGCSKNKVLSRKRAKSSLVDVPHNKTRQSWNQSQDEPWVDKYRPETQNDLAVQKKKIEEVETWLKMHIFQRQPKQVILLPLAGGSDMPNQFYRDPSSLHEILRRFVRTSRCPLIFIISDNFSGDSNQRLLFPKEILEELCISIISFKPVAPTNMMKVLNRIATAEANMVLYSVCVVLLLVDCSLEKDFWSRKKRSSTLKSETAAAMCNLRKKSKSDTSEDQAIQAIGGKDASIFLFHALGKIIYCKREPLPESEFPQLPSHLSEHRRDALLIHPEDIVEKSHMSGSMFNLYLHQNYVEFFTDIDDVVRASEYLSTADVLCGNWNSRHVMEEYSVSVSTRGVMHSNTSRAFAHCQGGVGFRPLHKPQWFFINSKYQENCIAAKSLFSSFCLPPECLQTELLPYLAKLANPMRNEAQIAFIQDVGRLPLKRNFGRLKLEALTDKDPGVPDLLAGYEENPAEMHAAEVAVQVEENRTSENDWDGLPPASSQHSGSELPCSQPQPVAAQVAMEEDELNIEEYDSD
ncbi:hypothetical protein ASZ78_014458 [Callipepla squamata]|uniref:Checkpoint protein RAD24-like helical bundle domain-containing protein n=1 Tax=Callipepla squamata TaxID=9009 RepID=A0A226N4G2_CALSU|nr:hypothetical protein ASZ78_014458 [Callipepla squamata]